MSKLAGIFIDTKTNYTISRLFGRFVVQRSSSHVAPGAASLFANSRCFPTRQNVSASLSVKYPHQKYSQHSPNLVPTEPDKLYSMVEVECRGHETAVLQSYLTFVSTAAGHLDVTLQEVEWPRKHIQRWTLLKSVHIYKKHRVQYEVRTHFLIMRFVKLTGSTADTFLEYIQRNLPEGIAMKVTKHELQKLPEHVTPSSEVIQ
ncbi:small ribosomal subunit protein uS10m-like [Macrobrachium nipponense]|uniref:small ribosomal subunit protein uS10m-like n=1 Tax=Macrobrachium nipponense TaxID=159736 RepID=UPI0030C8A09E